MMQAQRKEHDGDLIDKQKHECNKQTFLQDNNTMMLLFT